MTALATGTIAPDFTLQSSPDQHLSLAELRGRPVVLVFYPADWSPVCGDQLGLYNELREGVIRRSYVSPVGINPGAGGILAALEALPGGAS
jgi:peroxiredoxin